jgi:hypothetical protein
VDLCCEWHGGEESKHFGALYGMYAVTPNELKAILKVIAQEGQSGAVNKTSVE